MELNEDEMEVANEEESHQNSAGRRREKFRKHKCESENALGVKLRAPRRLWALNRRGTYPNFTLLFYFSNKVTMTSVTWSKPTSLETLPRRLGHINLHQRHFKILNF